MWSSRPPTAESPQSPAPGPSPEVLGGWLPAVGCWLKAVGCRLSALFGMPDYTRYLDHQARCHPGEQVVSEKEFVRGELERKYAGGGSRCC